MMEYVRVTPDNNCFIIAPLELVVRLLIINKGILANFIQIGASKLPSNVYGVPNFTPKAYTGDRAFR
jgi:hypothetical protein